MDTFAQVISNIIKEQQAIIGPVALDQARKVNGLTIVGEDDIKIAGDKKQVLDSLINQYSKLFGKASVEVCKNAISPFIDKIPPSDLPNILKS
jgi:hypothetical protein